MEVYFPSNLFLQAKKSWTTLVTNLFTLSWMKTVRRWMKRSISKHCLTIPFLSYFIKGTNGHHTDHHSSKSISNYPSLYKDYKCKMLGHLSEILKFLWNGTYSLTSNFCSPRELHGVNFKSDSTQTFPDTYSNQRYAIFMCEKHLYCLMIPQLNVVFLGLPDYKVPEKCPVIARSN